MSTCSHGLNTNNSGSKHTQALRSSFMTEGIIPQGWCLNWVWPTPYSNWLLQHWCAGGLASCRRGSYWARHRKQLSAEHDVPVRCGCPEAAPGSLYSRSSLAIVKSWQNCSLALFSTCILQNQLRVARTTLHRITGAANIVACIYPLAVLPVQHVQHLKYSPLTEPLGTAVM